MSEPLTPEREARLRELLDEAGFPPPWDDIVQGTSNRALAVAAVNALPWLLAELDRLRAELDKVVGNTRTLIETVRLRGGNLALLLQVCNTVERHLPEDTTGRAAVTQPDGVSQEDDRG